MKRLFTIIIAAILCAPRRAFGEVQFANDGDRADVLVGFSNDMEIGDDGWAMIAPYGDFPGMAIEGNKQKPAIQRIDKAAAQEMVNEFSSFTSRVKRFVAGRNVYLGHPDVPAVTHKYPDKSPKGVFVELAARDDGFYGRPVFTNEGISLVEQKKVRALSGRWTALPTGELVDGKPVYKPAIFHSAGLTNTPNLPVQLLNEATSDEDAAERAGETKSTMKKAVIIALLQKLGVQIANDASDDQVNAALANGESKVVELTTAQTNFANEKTARETAQTNFANERKAHIASLLDVAIVNGQITAAERGTWEGRLGVDANFANEKDALLKLEKKIKTTSLTVEHGGRKVEIANEDQRREFTNEFIAGEMKTNGGNYRAAWNKLQSMHPQVLAQMKSPEIKAGVRK